MSPCALVLQHVTLSMMNDDVRDFVAMIEGYYHLYVDKNKTLLKVEDSTNNNTEQKGKTYQDLSMLIKKYGTPFYCLARP